MDEDTEGHAHILPGELHKRAAPRKPTTQRRQRQIKGAKR